MKAEVFRSNKESAWRFRILGDNGEVVAQSEAYVRRIDAVETARGLITPGSELTIEGEDDD